MRIAETKVYSYNELSPAAQEKARDWFREGAYQYDWWDCIYRDAKALGRLMGLSIDEIWFSGFYSQGDGACFEGVWHARDVQPGKVAELAPEDRRLHYIASRFESIAKTYPDAWLSVKHRGHYHHEGCTEFDIDFGDETTVTDHDAEEELIGAARGFMRWIYSTLEQEWEWLNADMQVVDCILLNEYEFDEDGEIWKGE